MAKVRRESIADPLADAHVARLAADTLRKVHAVGLIDELPGLRGLSYAAVRQAIARVREAGVAAYAATRLDQPRPGPPDLVARHLAQLDAIVEETPFPATEWRPLFDLFGRDRLAQLLNISPASAGRYERGARRTPDAVAARLHFLALLVGDLAGAYNPIGIRRWFERPRTLLDGRRPADLLTGAWQPDHAGPARVRALGRSLVESTAT